MAFARFFASIVILLLSSSAFAEEAKNRVALVIGNSAYRHSPLPNAANDAKLMAEKLESGWL